LLLIVKFGARRMWASPRVSTTKIIKIIVVKKATENTHFLLYFTDRGWYHNVAWVQVETVLTCLIVDSRRVWDSNCAIYALQSASNLTI